MVADEGVKDRAVADSPVSVLEDEVLLNRSRIYLFIFVMFICVLLLFTVVPTEFF